MSPLKTVDQALDALQRVKSGAPAFCTNFFPARPKLQLWIEQGELLGDFDAGTALVFRKDRDFWHLYFCAASAAALRSKIFELASLKTHRLAMDLIGNETSLTELVGLWEAAGFRRYSRLLRLARANHSGNAQTPAGNLKIGLAQRMDAAAILTLLEESFDRYADQLPTLYELEAALENRQVLTIKCRETLAALLFFETQGLTSTVRYWVVAPEFRSSGLGSSLIRYYFDTQIGARRFILWVTANNENAVQKYEHYGYRPDGLIDQVLVNELIPS